MKNIYAVIGLQFGDECKGSFTQYLASLNTNNLIIRFNGGHQAGHTVVNNGIRHIFSSFGSGTLIGVPTYWSKYCTIYPTSLLTEFGVLKEKGITPKIYFDPLCPITTPYDVFYNKETNSKTKHGSVGVGFGATIKRQEDNYKLYYQDLFNITVLEAKIANIKKYYDNINLEEEIDFWFLSIKELQENGVFTQEKLYINNYNNLIFEGAQGILLDMDFGFFPNVTRSNTTSKNIFSIIKDFNIRYNNLEIFYITRCYQTRHGNGFMSNEGSMPKLINTENEINLNTSYQGNFRKSILDLDLIKYAIQCDNHFSNGIEKSIVMTCVDQLPDNKISYTKNQVTYEKNINNFKSALKEEFGFPVFLGIKEGEFDFKSKEKTFKYGILFQIHNSFDNASKNDYWRSPEKIEEISNIPIEEINMHINKGYYGYKKNKKGEYTTCSLYKKYTPFFQKVLDAYIG